jgi:hypothetical protein
MAIANKQEQKGIFYELLFVGTATYDFQRGCSGDSVRAHLCKSPAVAALTSRARLRARREPAEFSVESQPARGAKRVGALPIARPQGVAAKEAA